MYPPAIAAKRYTVGFLFNPDLTRVLLVEKTRPDWQKGNFNGPGGKYEEGEDAPTCIAREVREETGLDVAIGDWRHVGKLAGPVWEVDILAAVYSGPETDAATLTDERVVWIDASPLPANIIPNLRWIVPYCQDVLRQGEIEHAVIRYTA